MGKIKRKFTTAFKIQAVEEIMSQKATAAQVARRYGLCHSQVSEWLDRYQEGRLGHIYNDMEEDPNYLKQRVAELERVIGQQHIEIAHLKKANRFVLERQHGRSSVITAKILDRSGKPAES